MSDRLIDVFAEGLKLDSSDLTEETSPRNTPQWDSLASMTMVMLLEDTFDVQLTTREIMKMDSIRAARALLRTKGATDL